MSGNRRMHLRVDGRLNEHDVLCTRTYWSLNAELATYDDGGNIRVRTTDDPARVTCGQCRKAMRLREAVHEVIDHRRGVLEALA